VRASNPDNDPTKGTVAFFSVAAANPDSKVHARSFYPEGATHAAATDTDPIRVHMMGKLNGTSSDFDDIVFNVHFTA
jgi:hypothetical protein